MNRHIYITGLYSMPEHVRRLQPSHLISIIQPELQPARPSEIPAQSHLRIEVHDISEPDDFSVFVQPDDIRRLVTFADTWSPEVGSLLIHCYAGVSRSTAAALVAHLLKTGDPESSALALYQAAPHASPNRRIIALADAELGLGGELVRATACMGPPHGPFDDEAVATMTV